MASEGRESMESTSSSMNGDESSTIVGDNDSLGGYDSDEFYGRDVPDGPIFTFEDDDEDDAVHQHTSTKVTPEDWSDRLVSSVGEPCTLVIDQSTKEAWSAFADEVGHIRSNIKKMLHLNSEDEVVEMSDIIDLCFGEQSDFYRAFWNELGYDRLTFAKFFGTACLQMSYHESTDALFNDVSELRDSVLIEEKEYNKIWEKIANLKKIKLNQFVGSNRRPQCLWEILEQSVNNFLKKIIIDGRVDDIFCSLDDDKKWIQSSGRNELDHFGINKATHVKDNRKGFTSHFAASMPLIFPMGFIFERVGENQVKCFKRLLNQMFGSNSLNEMPDLNGVMNFSDRGYTIEETIFDYLVPSGASFLHTAKRISPFPFNWGKKSKNRSDRRTYLSETGSPALFIKEIFSGGRLCSIFAFRTGTGNISAVVTNTIHHHEWEAISLNLKHRLLWEGDKQHGLDFLHFPCMANFPELFGIYHEDMIEALEYLREERVDVLTLEQGTQCWFKGRMFSMTSSQSDGSFRKALIIYQANEHFCKVAKYLEGDNYYQCKLKSNFYFIVYFISFPTSLVWAALVFKSFPWS